MSLMPPQIQRKLAIPPQTIYELIELAKQGDVTAFEAIYDQHKDRVFRLCVRLTGNISDSEDLTQEVFLHAYRKLHSFRGEAAFSTWLHRIAFNAAMMFLRTRNKRLSMISTACDWDDDALGTMTAYPTYYGYKAFTRMALKQAIAALPRRRRQVLILHDVHGMTHTEVGTRLGIEPITSKSQLHYAHALVRNVLAGGDIPPSRPERQRLPPEQMKQVA